SGAIGLRVIVIWQLLCAAITPGQVLLCAKSGLVPGSSPIELMCSNPLPLFVIVTIAGAGVPLIGWLITTAGGLNVTTAAVACPMSVTSCGPPTASLGITTLPV